MTTEAERRHIYRLIDLAVERCEEGNLRERLEVSGAAVFEEAKAHPCVLRVWGAIGDPFARYTRSPRRLPRAT